MFVALGIQHAMRMPLIVICGLSGCTLWQDFGEKLLRMIVCFDFSIILRRIKLLSMNVCFDFYVILRRIKLLSMNVCFDFYVILRRIKLLSMKECFDFSIILRRVMIQVIKNGCAIRTNRMRHFTLNLFRHLTSTCFQKAYC